ncbi:MAG: hypothetical protein WCD04_06840 [Terriglobia bacterium]|jgi:hypothetical protein
MTWRQSDDSKNRQNKNAGNGGDLVKHTVYLTVLNYLLARSPWSNELRVRECHAGRGMYHIPSPDKRRPLLECLYDPIGSDVGVLLHDVQRGLQSALGVWPADTKAFEWYAGSALMNTWRLGRAGTGKHRHELYEQDARIRESLRDVLLNSGLSLPQVGVQIFPKEEDGGKFDGEAHIETKVVNWSSQDLILLDPFAMWREKEDQPQRDRYRSILGRLIALGQESPSLILFWTWGQNFPVAKGDLEGTNRPVRNGYQELRGLLHGAGRPFIRVAWRWELQFAMWVLVPEAHLNALRDALQHCCDDLRDHLLRHGCRKQDVEVAVDSGDCIRESPSANRQSSIVNRKSLGGGQHGGNRQA